MDLAKTLTRVLVLCAGGYLSKGYGQFKAAALADTSLKVVCDCMRRLHGQSTPAPAVTDPVAADKPGVSAFFTRERVFKDVFCRVPKERGLGLDAVSYEELGGLFHGGVQMYRDTLYTLVCAINAGRLHTDSLAILGDSLLYGLEKPDKSTRPIGVGSALRRLAGRCIYAQLKDEFGKKLTATKPTEAMLEAAGFAADTECMAPLQLGCGTGGGAEIAIAMIRLQLELNPKWAVLSDDKRNGYNALWREAIFRGVREYFPELLPTVRMFYARDGGLYTKERPRTSAEVEAAGEEDERLPQRGYGPRPAVPW